MLEKKKKRVREGGVPTGDGLFDDVPPAGGTVDVAHGPYRESLPVAEMSISVLAPA